MSKKSFIYALVLCGLVLSLAACGGNGVSCPDGYKLQSATANNPNGFCKSDTGDVVPVVVRATLKIDLGDNNANPVQTAVCSMSDQSIVCQK